MHGLYRRHSTVVQRRWKRGTCEGEESYSQARLVTIKHPGSSCEASHKSNPSYIPQGYAEISNLHHVRGCNRCGADSL